MSIKLDGTKNVEAMIKSPIEATLCLAKKHKDFSQIIKKFGPCELNWRKDRSTHFASLVETICYQQLAGKAAASIHTRVLKALGGVTPENVMSTSDVDLRSAGLSQNKLLSIRSLTEHVMESKLNLRSIGKYDDEQVIEKLVQVRGIGRWSAQMFLIDRLKRLDVWPTGDYGVRAGSQILFKKRIMPTEKEMKDLVNKYKPYRTIVAWYCWKLADERK